MQQEPMKQKLVLNSNRKHGAGIPVFVLVNENYSKNFSNDFKNILKKLCNYLNTYSNSNYPCFLAVLNVDYDSLSFDEHGSMNSIARDGAYTKIESIRTEGTRKVIGPVMAGYFSAKYNSNVLDCIKQFKNDYPWMRSPVIIFLDDTEMFNDKGLFRTIHDSRYLFFANSKGRIKKWLAKNYARVYCLTNSQAVKLAFKEMVTGTYMFSDVKELAKCAVDYRPPVKKPEPSKVAVDTIGFEIPILANAKFDNED